MVELIIMCVIIGIAFILFSYELINTINDIE